VEETRRGKVLAFYVLGITLVAPIGALLQGVLVNAIGARAAFTLAGLAFLLLLAVLRSKRSLERLDDRSLEPQ
jgi:MFS family permease